MEKYVQLSMHAASVCKARTVTFEEILETLENYENRYSSTHHQGKWTPDTYVYQRGTLAVVVHENSERLLVKTVLLRDPHQWDDEDVRARHRPAPTRA